MLQKIVFSLALLLSTCFVQGKQVPHVVIISIDGLPASMLDDPRSPLPTLRALARQGTIAEGMLVSNPSVTWPNHTTLVTGVHPRKHSVIFNGTLERGNAGQPVEINPRKDQSELVAVPTLHDLAHRAGLTTAEVNWPATRGATTLDFSFPDVPEVFQHATPRLRRELIQLGIITEDQKAWDWSKSSPAGRDHIYTRIATHILQQHQPQLFLFHLLNVDAIHHQYGPGNAASYSALAYADACVKEILAALEAAGIREHTNIFIVSDHGFHHVDQIILPNVVLRQNQLLTTSGFQVTSARAQAITVGGAALVYLTDPATRAEDQRQVLDLFAAMEGIDRILLPEDYAAFDLPDRSKNERMADLVLAAKPGYAFARQAHGDDPVLPSSHPGFYPGHHGFLSTDPKMNATFIASGPAIQKGKKIALVSNIDLAPTAAHLLGFEMPSADGRILTEILEPDGF
jgi:predicted AlkP superfamily pyrophosphatase or phosphodiesterase